MPTLLSVAGEFLFQNFHPPNNMTQENPDKSLTVVENVESMTPRQFVASNYIRDQVAKALPSMLTAERYMRVCLTSFNRNPKLLDCSKSSIASVILQCAQWGIEPDGRHAHIIPYNGEATLQLDYKGLVALVRRSGEVVSIHCDVVCKGDVFKTSLGVVVEHEPNYSEDAGEVYAVYATAKLKDGSSQSVVLRKSEVEAIRKRSRSGSSGPWTTDWNEMAKKTSFKRLSKWLPLASEAAHAIEYDNRKEFGTSTIDVTPSEPAPTAAKILAQPKPAKKVKKPEPAEETDEPLEVDDGL